jgi:hypothetical protein
MGLGRQDWLRSFSFCGYFLLRGRKGVFAGAFAKMCVFNVVF